MDIYKPIQLIPPGLLGFFDLKSEGKAPSEIPSLLQPILEMRKWYFVQTAQRMADVDATRDLTDDLDGFVIPTSDPIIVPSGEWWYVHNLLGKATMPAVANEVIQFAMAWIEPENFLDYEVFEPSTSVPSSSATATRQYFAVAHDFWAPPGAMFCWYVGACETATVIPAALNGRYSRLPI